MILHRHQRHICQKSFLEHISSEVHHVYHTHVNTVYHHADTIVLHDLIPQSSPVRLIYFWQI